MPKLPTCSRSGCKNRVSRPTHKFCSSKCGQLASRTEKSAKPTESIQFKDDKCEITKTTPTQVRTLADLIRVCDIDTTQWEVERWVCNKWEMGALPDGYVEVVVTPLFQIKAWLRKINQTTLALREGLLEDIRREVKRGAPAIVKYPFVNKGFLFEFSPFDLHLGKLAWGEETVTDYDSAIATDLFNASLEYLLNQALKLSDGKLERILCVFGNDVSHSDSKRAETTMGTRMDVDTRFIKMFRRICQIHRFAVDRLVQIAPVDCSIVPGNHDELTAFHLGEILAARYDGTKHVKIDNSPRLRKYYEYGVNLFGFTHGDAERVSELPILMAREEPEMWQRCPSREWHIGHKHISEKFEARSMRKVSMLEQDLFSDKGIRVRRLTSLSAHDAWHTKHGYTDRRACEAFVFHKTAGFTSHLSFNLDHFTGQAVSK